MASTTDGLGRTPPARVGGAHRAGDRIVEQQRGAVSGEDHQGNTGGIGYQAVALGVIPVAQAIAVLFRHHPDDIRMDLHGHDQFLRVKAQSLTQNVQVFLHILHAVTPADGQVQAGLGAGADTAKAGGEAV